MTLPSLAPVILMFLATLELNSNGLVKSTLIKTTCIDDSREGCGIRFSNRELSYNTTIFIGFSSRTGKSFNDTSRLRLLQDSLGSGYSLFVGTCVGSSTLTTVNRITISSRETSSTTGTGSQYPFTMITSTERVARTGKLSSN